MFYGPLERWENVVVGKSCIFLPVVISNTELASACVGVCRIFADEL